MKRCLTPWKRNKRKLSFDTYTQSTERLGGELQVAASSDQTAVVVPHSVEETVRGIVFRLLATCLLGLQGIRIIGVNRTHKTDRLCEGTNESVFVSQVTLCVVLPEGEDSHSLHERRNCETGCEDEDKEHSRWDPSRTLEDGSEGDEHREDLGYDRAGEDEAPENDPHAKLGKFSAASRYPLVDIVDVPGPVVPRLQLRDFGIRRSSCLGSGDAPARHSADDVSTLSGEVQIAAVSDNPGPPFQRGLLAKECAEPCERDEAEGEGDVRGRVDGRCQQGRGRETDR